MRVATTWSTASLAVLLIATGCSKDTPSAAAARETSTATATAPQEKARTACAMVTSKEMSTIAGTTLSATREDGVGPMTCLYKPPDGSTPYVKIEIDWGGGSAAMMASGILGRLEPGMSDPMAGLGDQASAIGPVLMVRTGDDLLTLTLWGLDDRIAAAKRIVNLIRPRMGASAQAKGNTSDGSGRDGGTTDNSARDLANAGQLVSGLLSGLAEHNDRSHAAGTAGANAASNGAPTSAPIDEPAYDAFSGPAIRIPLVAGLTLVGAESEPGRGDYEPIVTIARVTSDIVSTVFSANLPEGTRLQVDRNVRREDLRQARGFRSWYVDRDPRVFTGTTAYSLSAAVLNDLKTKGQADVVRVMPDQSPLAAVTSLLNGAGKTSSGPEQPGTLRRVEPHAVAFPVLVNDEPVHVPAIHARGTFGEATIDFHLLDDPDNPLLLRLTGTANGRIVRIAFPTTAAAPIEEKLKKDARVELHGIYFDFGKATLRPESEPVLRDIATALTHNPSWTINIEGHTDNLGGDAPNLELSRRRADAVKQALVERYRVPARSLTTAGFGASRPNASNDTLPGRARNRRVELVRQVGKSEKPS